MSIRFRKATQLLALSQLIVLLGATTHGWADSGSPGDALDDGTETYLTSQELAAVEVWAKSSEADLKDLLQSTRDLSPGQAKAILIHGIRDVVLASAPKSTEMLMRFALNRAVKVVDTMEQSGHSDRPGEADQEERVLTRSIEFALAYYQNDLAYLNAETANPGSEPNLPPLPYAKFGGEYAQFLMSVNESLINASAQYNVGMLVLDFLQVDLDRDSKKTEYAVAIEEIARMRRLWPDTAPALDSDSIKGLKEIHRVYFDVIGTLQSSGLVATPPQNAPTTPPPIALTPSKDPYQSPDYSEFLTDLVKFNDWQSKYISAPSRSWEEKDAARQRDFYADKAKTALTNWIDHLPADYQTLENIGVKFHGEYIKAASNSAPEALYRAVETIAFTRAEEGFTNQVASMSANELLNVQNVYQQKFVSAPSRSTEETYFAAIRDIARRAIDQRGPR